MTELDVDDTSYSMEVFGRHRGDVGRCKDCSHRSGSDGAWEFSEALGFVRDGGCVEDRGCVRDGGCVKD